MYMTILTLYIAALSLHIAVVTNALSNYYFNISSIYKKLEVPKFALYIKSLHSCFMNETY